MDTAIGPSTFFLTFLMFVGLFFFIRASTKDRIETAHLVSHQDETTLMSQLKAYFQARAYRVAAVDVAQNQVTFEGFVRPSVFLTVFLTLLAAAGLLCLSLVLYQIFPSFNRSIFLLLVIFSPLSGFYYWKKAGRLEKVLLSVASSTDDKADSSTITVVAHRDELLELQKSLQLNRT